LYHVEIQTLQGRSPLRMALEYKQHDVSNRYGPWRLRALLCESIVFSPDSVPVGPWSYTAIAGPAINSFGVVLSRAAVPAENALNDLGDASATDHTDNEPQATTAASRPTWRRRVADWIGKLLRWPGYGGKG
jgi:hypothetical protein